jgi:tetratricopeptide (TPR) repeat protein
MNGWKVCHILLFIIYLLLYQSAVCQAGGNEETLFQQGNEAYSRGDYEQAIAHYEELSAAAGLSPGVLYNLANSYAQAGKIGRAVLNYERALRLDPADSDIAGNLELLRKESSLFSSEAEGADRLFHFLSLNQWAMLGFLVLVGFTLFQTATIKYRLAGRTSIGVKIVCTLLLSLAVTGTIISYQHFKPAVVIAADARLLISPFASATSVGAIQEGRLVYPQKNHGPFTYVRDESNRQGWILSTDIEIVCVGSKLPITSSN